MNIARFLPIAGTIGLVVAVFVATQATKHATQKSLSLANYHAPMLPD